MLPHHGKAACPCRVSYYCAAVWYTLPLYIAFKPEESFFVTNSSAVVACRCCTRHRCDHRTQLIQTFIFPFTLSHCTTSNKWHFHYIIMTTFYSDFSLSLILFLRCGCKERVRESEREREKELRQEKCVITKLHVYSPLLNRNSSRYYKYIYTNDRGSFVRFKCDELLGNLGRAPCPIA